MIRARKNRWWLMLAIIGCVAMVIVIAAVGIIPALTAKGCHPDRTGSSGCEGCEVPSTIPIDTYPTAGGDVIWSLDCRYFAAVDRHGSSLNPYYHWTIYETTAWTPICEVGEGDVMLGQGMVGGYCELPLSNGQTWVVLGGSSTGSQSARHVRFFVCQDPHSVLAHMIFRRSRDDGEQ